MLSNFLIIPVVKEKIKVKLALAILTGALTTLADEIIQTPLLAALNQDGGGRGKKPPPPPPVFPLYLLQT